MNAPPVAALAQSTGAPSIAQPRVLRERGYQRAAVAVLAPVVVLAQSTGAPSNAQPRSLRDRGYQRAAVAVLAQSTGAPSITLPRVLRERGYERLLDRGLRSDKIHTVISVGGRSLRLGGPTHGNPV